MFRYLILESFDGNGQTHKNSGETTCPAAISLYDYITDNCLRKPLEVMR